jgi:hypothetical protein
MKYPADDIFQERSIFFRRKISRFCKLRSYDKMNHTQRLRILLTSLFLLSFKPVFAQAPLPSLPDIESAGSLGEDLFVQSGSTGMVLVIVRDSQVFFRGYGEATPNSQKPPTEDSLLRLCSLTKIFTTDVLTKLVMDRTVRLNDPLQRLLRVVRLCPNVANPSLLRISRRTHPVSRVNSATLLAAHRISPFQTTALAGVGCQINASAALQVPLPSTRTSPSTFSATLSSPPHTGSMQLFLQSALSLPSTCETQRSSPALRNAAICSSAPMTKAPARPLKKLPEVRASTPRLAIWRSG